MSLTENDARLSNCDRSATLGKARATTAARRPSFRQYDLETVLSERKERAGFHFRLLFPDDRNGLDPERSFEECRAAFLAQSAVPQMSPSSSPDGRPGVQQSSPTMTMGTKEALADIMGMFQKPFMAASSAAEVEEPPLHPSTRPEPSLISAEAEAEFDGEEVEKTCTLIHLPVQKLVFDKLHVYRDDDESQGVDITVESAPIEPSVQDDEGDALARSTDYDPFFETPLQTPFPVRPLSILTPITEQSSREVAMTSSRYHSSARTTMTTSTSASSHSNSSMWDNTFQFDKSSLMLVRPSQPRELSLVNADGVIPWPNPSLVLQWLRTSSEMVSLSGLGRIQIQRVAPFRDHRQALQSKSRSFLLDGVLKDRDLVVEKLLGSGAFGTVYLTCDKSNPDEKYALKIEKPASGWEYHVLEQVRKRLIDPAATKYFSEVQDFVMFKDESWLLLPYLQQPPLLHLINALWRDGGGRAEDEIVAMYFVVELIRILDAMHQSGILHGDIKPDNLLIRLDSAVLDNKLSASEYAYSPQDPFWASIGLVCIDFGKAIDMRLVDMSTRFQTLCLESNLTETILEARLPYPWSWDLDFYGLLDIVRLLLFGNYWRPMIPDTLRGDDWPAALVCEQISSWTWKRYWQKDLWLSLVHVLASGPEKSFTAKWFQLRGVRNRMELWLAEQSNMTPVLSLLWTCQVCSS